MECKLQGTLMDIKVTQKKQRPYLVIYSDGQLLNVFLKEGDDISKYSQHLTKFITVTVKAYEPKFIQTV